MTSVGNEVRDGFKQTHNWVSNNVEFLSDIEQFYRQRSVIEKDYASSLQRLTAEFMKKKANKSTSISVGDEPLITPGSLESSTLSAWNEILSSTEVEASNHANFSKELSFKVSDVCTQLQFKCNNLLKSVDTLYNDQMVVSKEEFSKNVDKFKKNYDETCNSMESTRVKLEKKDNSKLQSKYKDKEFEMNAAKNDYLIKINVANRIKDKFYYQDLPELLDLLQDLNEFKTSGLNNILKNAGNLEINLNNKNIKILTDAIEVVHSNQPQLDTEMFIKHNSNASQWAEPQDFYYIPSSIWHDDENLITSDRELNELKKILIRSKGNISKLDDLLEQRREELNKLSQLKKASKENTESIDFRKDLELLQNYLGSLSNFISTETKNVESQVEVETIENNVDLSKDLSLEGLTIQKKKTGFFSKLRSGGGSTSHEKEKLINAYDDTQSIKTQETHHSSHFKLGSLLRSKSTASKKNDNDSITSAASVINQGTAIYPYSAEGDDETSMQAQESFTVVKLDDGSGWTLISKSDGSQGLVPTSYIQIQQSQAAPSTGAKRKGPEVKPRKNNQKKLSYCIVKFPYEMEEEGELTINEGEKLIVIQGDDDGWTTGENANGERGIFPTSYVEMM
jgi:hypothetical protein